VHRDLRLDRRDDVIQRVDQTGIEFQENFRNGLGRAAVFPEKAGFQRFWYVVEPRIKTDDGGVVCLADFFD